MAYVIWAMIDLSGHLPAPSSMTASICSMSIVTLSNYVTDGMEIALRALRSINNQVFLHFVQLQSCQQELCSQNPLTMTDVLLIENPRTTIWMAFLYLCVYPIVDQSPPLTQRTGRRVYFLQA
jgi:hypothetical protein